jgi:hypothetical protein
MDFYWLVLGMLAVWTGRGTWWYVCVGASGTASGAGSLTASNASACGSPHPSPGSKATGGWIGYSCGLPFQGALFYWSMRPSGSLQRPLRSIPKIRR